MSDYFIFDDIDTRDYEGILVYFNEVDTTPKRVGEFIQIPNRNGSFFLDGGRYEDVTHTYDIVALSKEYASDLINALASKVGYCRLEDSFNSNEFYSAIFNSEIEPKITKERDKLTFKVTFTRKPQRWLTSGESVVSVTSGDTITNPTLFDASPLLEVGGYGTINIGDDTINIADLLVGDINISDKVVEQNHTLRKTFSINEADYNAGDSIEIGGITIEEVFTITSVASYVNSVGPATMGIVYYNTTDSDATLAWGISGATAIYRITVPTITLTVGQNLSRSYSVKSTICIQHPDTRAQGVYAYNTISINYTNGKLTIYASPIMFSGIYLADYQQLCTITLGKIVGDSTISILDDTVYIDCDIGEAYAIRGGKASSLDKIVSFGADLPKLEPGANVITYSGAITSVKATPRWWKV